MKGKKVKKQLRQEKKSCKTKGLINTWAGIVLTTEAIEEKNS